MTATLRRQPIVIAFRISEINPFHAAAAKEMAATLVADGPTAAFHSRSTAQSPVTHKESPASPAAAALQQIIQSSTSG
jgi:hypothetical protein